jgi:hypothetical protein
MAGSICLATGALAKDRARAGAGPEIDSIKSGSTSGARCGAAYQTRTGNVVPPDNSPIDNPVVSGATVKKTCPGAIVATFSAEATGFITLSATAVCTATSGLPSPCTVGTTVVPTFGSGENYFNKDPASLTQIHSITYVWQNLPRGTWRINIRLGNGGAPGGSVDFRTLVVDSWSGG